MPCRAQIEHETLSATLNTAVSLSGAIATESEMAATLYIPRTIGQEPYDGEYTVIPQPYDATVLPTRGKAMRDDVIIMEIPYYTTTNEKGGYTAIIGG